MAPTGCHPAFLDYETRPDYHGAMIYIAMIATMSRRLART
jgi:hypothetical protein